MASTTAELSREFLRRAQACGLHSDCLMDGSVNCEIAVVSDYPGEREKEKKTPLVGGAGKFLWDNLRHYNITRQHVYTTNVVKRVVHQSGSVKSPIDRHELSHWEGLLEWELKHLPNLKYVLIAGGYALRALTLENKITDWRGSVLDVKIGDRTVTGIVSFNPALVLREPKWEPIFRFDMNKLNRVIQGTYKPFEIESIINPSFNQAIRWIEKMQDEKLPVSFDIETMAQETVCVGLTNENHRGMCINLRDAKGSRFSVREERILHRRMQQLFLGRDTRLVAQNGNFDSYWLWYKDRVRVPRVWFDTLLAHHTLYPGLPHNLGFLTAQYTDHPFYKDEGKDWREGGDIDQFWRYNVKDICITRAVMDAELQELRNQGLEDFFFNHVMRLQPELVLMTVLGVKCDLSLKEKIKDELHEALSHKLEHFEKCVQDCVGDSNYSVNPNSPRQLSDLLFNRLRLVGRGTSTNKENRDRIMKHPRTPERVKNMLRVLDDYSKDRKFLSTYAEMEVDDDGRIRCEYKQYGVAKAPGRLSSSSTMWGSGMNLQNQPKRAYQMFVADPGYEFVYFDLSQAEARVVAFKAPVPALKENFALADAGRADVHRANAARIFGIPYEDTPVEDRNEDGSPSQRYLGKRCVTPDHEVLTDKGWTSIDEACTHNARIAVWSSGNENIKFEHPVDWYVGHVENEDVYSFVGRATSQRVTSDHRMPVYNNGKHGERLAHEVANKRYGSMPVHGTMVDGEYEPDARLLAMSWCDGTIEKNYNNSIRISVKKERKADRVRQLATERGYKLWESTDEDMYHFRVYGFHKKKLSMSMLSWDLASRTAFLEELIHWDGHAESGRIINTDLDGLHVIQAVAHVSGYQCVIKRHGNPRNNERQCYYTILSRRKFAYYKSMEVKHENYTGNIYCPTVSTGAFLVRHNGKVSITLNCVHGLNYRMGPDRLATVCNIPLWQAEQAYNAYHRAFPEIKQWWDDIIDEVRKNRCLYNAYGRRLLLMGRIDEDALESVVAFYPQSTIGDKVSRCIYLCHSDPEWPRKRDGTLQARMVLNVHDALIALARPQEREQVMHVMKRHAEEPLYIRGEELVIPAEMAVSQPDEHGVHRWSTLKKVK